MVDNFCNANLMSVEMRFSFSFAIGIPVGKTLTLRRDLVWGLLLIIPINLALLRNIFYEKFEISRYGSF